MNKKIGLFLVIMLIVNSIDSIRNLPATALFGSNLIFFFIFSAIVFLIPTALVSAKLAQKFPNQGGIYYWVKQAFGHRMAFLAVWLQWINTLIWYPTILSFIAATAVYIFDEKLAQNKFYLISTILGTFWLLTYINLKGIKTSAIFNSICGIIGTIIPMAFIIILGLTWGLSGKPLQIHFALHDLLPSFNESKNWISLTAIITAFLGMELTAVHVNHIKNAQKIYPKAVILSAIIILITLTLGSLAIAFVLPHHDINLVDGVLQAFAAFFAAYHLSWLMPIMTLLILIGTFGGIINWVISPAKGLLQAAEDGYLPKLLCNQKNILILQGLLVTLFCSAYLLMPSVNGSYWLLTALSTQLYVLMYVIMFFAAIALNYKSLPMWCLSLLGITGCCITLIIGFFPPDGINVGGFLHYETIFTTAMIALILPVGGFYFYNKLNGVKINANLSITPQET